MPDPCSVCHKKKCKCASEPLELPKATKRSGGKKSAKELPEPELPTSRKCQLCWRLEEASNPCGPTICHGTEGCPWAAETLCERCDHRGHLDLDCTAVFPTRPKTLEELIPLHLRLRWNITTHTSIKFSPKRSRSEISDDNTLTVIDTVDGMREFIEKYGVKVDKEGPGRRGEDLLHDAIEDWGIRHGYRILYKQHIKKRAPKISPEQVEDATASHTTK